MSSIAEVTRDILIPECFAWDRGRMDRVNVEVKLIFCVRWQKRCVSSQFSYMVCPKSVVCFASWHH